MSAALFTAFNKTQKMLGLARTLSQAGMAVCASGGTATFLQKNGVQAIDIADIVGEAILGHRVVTLSREIYAMILARQDREEDGKELARLSLPFIELVYMDPYPFREAVTTFPKTEDEVLEMIDIGGPTLVRAAAKGRRIVLCGESGIDEALQFFINGGGSFANVSARERATFAFNATSEMAEYDKLVSLFYAAIADGTLEEWRRLMKT